MSEWFSSIYCIGLRESTSQAQCGGKAFNLARLASFGIAVPDSFVITREALTRFLDDSGVGRVVEDYLTALQQQSREDADSAFQSLSQVVLSADIPTDIKRAVESRTSPMLQACTYGLAIRSSAIDEDSAHASFAGVFESFLGVGSHESMWMAIRRCWCSLWRPSAVTYGHRMGMPVKSDGMAVLVQQTIAADSAGVFFSADPMTGNPWKVLVNSTFGLAQSLVDGVAPADRFLLDWATGEILEEQVAVKRVMLRAQELGVTSVSVPLAMVSQPSLDADQLQTLWNVGMQIDSAFAGPVDVEWAMSQDHLIVLQARLITALPEFFPHRMSPEDRQDSWLLSSPYWYVPAEVDGNIVAPIFRHLWDAKMWRRAVPEGLSLLSRDCRERDFNGYRYCTDGWSGVSGAWLDVLESRGQDEEIKKIFREAEDRLDQIEHDLRGTWTDGKRETTEALAAARDMVAHTTGARELVPAVLERLQDDPRGNYLGYGAPQSLGELCQRMLKRHLHELIPEFQGERLVRGLPSYSYARLASAQKLGRDIDDPQAGEMLKRLPVAQVMERLRNHHPNNPLVVQFEEFCWEFGQCPPSWSDRPAMWTRPNVAWAEFAGEIMVTIKRSYLGDVKDVRTIQQYNQQKRLQAEQELLSHLPATLHARCKKLLNWAQFWIPILDDRLWLGGCDYLARYELLWHLAKRLTGEKIIEKPEHVFLLTLEDIEASTSESNEAVRTRYLKNRSEYRNNKRLRPPPYLGRPHEQSQAQKSILALMESYDGIARDGTLSGIGRSPGKVKGNAWVASGLTPQDLDALTDENILVCLEDIPYRVDWLGAFLVIGGLVAANQCGAGLHHAAQIARECGVVYVELSTETARCIPHGAIIEVDGNVGTVRIATE